MGQGNKPPCRRCWVRRRCRRAACGPGRQEELGGFAVTKGVEGDFHAFQQFLDDDLAASRAEFLSEHDFVNGQGSLRRSGADDDAFPQGQAVGFDGATAPQGVGKIAGGPASEKVPARAVGMPYFSMNLCEKTLEDSNWAAWRFGPRCGGRGAGTSPPRPGPGDCPGRPP